MDTLTNLFLSYEDGSNSSSQSSSSPFPSFFDLYLHERLVSIVRPAYDHVLTILNDSFPEVLSRVSIYREEYYAMLLFFIEFVHLQAYDALLVESFYGLKRWKVKYGEDSKTNISSTKIIPMSQRDKLISLALAILVPYFRNRFKMFLYNDYMQNNNRNNNNNSNSQNRNIPQDGENHEESVLNIDNNRNESNSSLIFIINNKLQAIHKRIKIQLRKVIPQLYPRSSSNFRNNGVQNSRQKIKQGILKVLGVLDSAFDISYIFYRFLYITQLSPHYTPLLAMQNIVLKKLSATDYQRFQEATNYRHSTSSSSSPSNTSQSNESSSISSTSISTSVRPVGDNQSLVSEKRTLHRYIRLANYTRMTLLLLALTIKYLEFLRHNETENMDDLVGDDGYNEDSVIINNDNNNNYISNNTQRSLSTSSNNTIAPERRRRNNINLHHHSKTLVPAPEPPNLINQINYNDTEPTIRLPRDNSLCPLCKKKRTNPCISRGGVCYCYRCIINYLRDKKEGNPSATTRCPVTNEPLTENMIRRLYV